MKAVKMVVLVGLVAGGVLFASAGKRDLNGEEENKQIVKGAIRAMNEGDFAVMGKLYSRRFVQHTPEATEPTKWPDCELAMRILHNRLPTLRFEVQDIIAEGDKVAVRLSWSYRHKKYFSKQGNPEGNIRGTEMDMFRIEAGRIVEEWCEADPKQFSRLLRVIGYMGRGKSGN